MGGRGGFAAFVVALAALVAGAPPARATDDLTPNQWGIPRTGTDLVQQQGYVGAGIDVAVVDSGIHLTHQEFAGRIGPGVNLVDPGAPPQDDVGHGTHVAGIIGAARGDGGTVGVAPAVRLLPVKVLDDDGSGSSDDVAAGIRWAVDNGAEVINLSLGSDTQFLFGPSTTDAVDYAWAHGVICVFAAGNNFLLGSGFSDEPALVVSATSRSDQKSYFSDGVGAAQWGLSAPGGAAGIVDPAEEDILSTYWQAGGRNDTYAYLAGTSMAAPFVSGAAAVLRGIGLTPQQTVDTLLATAHDLGGRGFDSTFGYGRLDLSAAVAAATGVPAPTPTTAPTAATPNAPAAEPAADPGPAADAGSGGGSGGSGAAVATSAGSATSGATDPDVPAAAAPELGAAAPGQPDGPAVAIDQPDGSVVLGIEDPDGDGTGLPGAVAALAATGTGIAAVRVRRRALVASG